jgi:hypothetical protein
MGMLRDAISGVIGYQTGRRRADTGHAAPRPVTAESATAALRSAIAQGEQVMRSQGVELSEAESILRGRVHYGGPARPAEARRDRCAVRQPRNEVER